MIPNSRETFKEFCLRALGDGAIEVNVTEEQVDDAVDRALSFYIDYHYDATEKIYYKYQVTDSDKTNGYITVPDYIIGVTSIFTVGSLFETDSFWNIGYQLALNDLWTFASISMVPYYQAFQHIQFIEELLVGKMPIRYNRRDNKIYVDTNWEKLAVGEYLIFDCYQTLDPDSVTKIWKDRWLFEYCAAIIKQYWGTNTKKYNRVPLPGGIFLDGQKIYDEATVEIERLEKQCKNSFQEFPSMQMG